MVFFAVSHFAKFPAIFVNGNINARSYCDNILAPTIASINEAFADINWIWQQDSATPHSAHITQVYLSQNTPRFIASQQWPPNSPYITVMVYYIFGRLKQKVYSH